jgi:hypothetical protein
MQLAILPDPHRHNPARRLPLIKFIHHLKSLPDRQRRLQQNHTAVRVNRNRPRQKAKFLPRFVHSYHFHLYGHHRARRPAPFKTLMVQICHFRYFLRQIHEAFT